MTEDKALYTRKIKRTARMLFFQRHRKPGVKGWELRRAVGKNYLKIGKLLNVELEKIGFKIKVVSEENTAIESLSEEQMDKAWFFVTPTESVGADDAAISGWRIDDLAVLAASIAFITSRQGKSPRGDVEKMLDEKLPEWRVAYNLDRFVRMGYLAQDENQVLLIGWRTLAEVDQKTLMELIITENSHPI